MSSELNASFQILPSLLSADFCRLGSQVDALKNGGCRILHLDVMDGHFVPNLTFGPPVVKTISAYTDLAFDVHLMVTDPDDWTEAFDFPNTRCITVHAEAGYHLHRSLQKIRERGKMAGLSLNPATPLSILDHLWPYLDLILIMTVNPGFGAQTFIETCREKIHRLHQLIREKTNGRVVLEIDGGVNASNLEELVGLGAQWVVTGNALFSEPDLSTAFGKFQNCGENAWKRISP